MDGKKAIETLQKRYKRQNDYIKNSFDRVSITLPKGTKDRIKANGYSINGLINELVIGWLNEQEQTRQADLFDLPDLPELEDMPFH